MTISGLSCYDVNWIVISKPVDMFYSKKKKCVDMTWGQDRLLLSLQRPMTSHIKEIYHFMML
jgi:hypothetical protein